MFQEDTGYADFIKSISHASKWSAIVLDNDETVRVKHEETTTDETQISNNDKDGSRASGESRMVVRTNASVVELGTADDVSPIPKTQSDGKAVKTPWGWEQMTELYEEMFGPEAPRLDGMGGFELPMEPRFAALLTRNSVSKAQMLFPSAIEVRPVDLGWSRVKLSIRFAPWVTRERIDFPVHRYDLVWSWCILVKWKGRLLKHESDAEEAAEPPASMYDGIRWVVDHWTEQAAKKQIDLSVVDEAWGLDARADMAGLEDEASKDRLYDAVSKMLASSRSQDDEARACGVVDWADADPDKLGAGPRTRTYLAIEAMYRYCASQEGEEKLGMIAQHLKEGRHAPPALLKKRAGQAAKDSKPAQK